MGTCRSGPPVVNTAEEIVTALKTLEAHYGRRRSADDRSGQHYQ